MAWEYCRVIKRAGRDSDDDDAIALIDETGSLQEAASIEVSRDLAGLRNSAYSPNEKLVLLLNSMGAENWEVASHVTDGDWEAIMLKRET